MDSLTPQFGVTLEAAITNALTEVMVRLEAAASTPRTRALRNQARSYVRAVNNWLFVPPTAESKDAMLELVTDLQQEVLAEKEGAT